MKTNIKYNLLSKWISLFGEISEKCFCIFKKDIPAIYLQKFQNSILIELGSDNLSDSTSGINIHQIPYFSFRIEKNPDDP